MGASILFMSMSLDGYVAGPNESMENGLGDGGERLHEWIFAGAETDENGVPGLPSGVNGRVIARLMETGAIVTGRSTFEMANGWGGDHHDGVPIFDLGRSAPVPEAADWPLVTYLDDVAEAMARARDAAGEKEILVHGVTGARLALAAGLLDEIQISVVPILLGSGRRLLDDGAGLDQTELEAIETVADPEATHLRYRVLR